jgi:hypothetical protein
MKIMFFFSEYLETVPVEHINSSSMAQGLLKQLIVIIHPVKRLPTYRTLSPLLDPDPWPVEFIPHHHTLIYSMVQDIL